MNATMPRLLGDMTDRLGMQRPFLNGHIIRVEDSRTDQEYNIRAELPGLDPERDVQVSADNHELTILAERRYEANGQRHSEFHYGALRRTIRMPGNADTQNAQAIYHQGVLEISIPLRPEKTGHQIPVSVT